MGGCYEVFWIGQSRVSSKVLDRIWIDKNREIPCIERSENRTPGTNRMAPRYKYSVIYKPT